MKEEILYAVANHVARITLNRPQRMNALSISMRRRWVDVITEFNRDPEVRAGVLTSAGDKAFCAGVDLKEMAERDSRGKHRAGSRSTGQPLMPVKPVIAAINGFCLAGGLEIALMCDVRVASVNASFGLPEVRRGLLPTHAVNLLPGLIPRGEAAYLLLTGERIDAQKALAIGLVHKVLSDKGQAEVEAARIAASIALGAPLAVRAIKELLATTSGIPTEHGYRLAIEALARLHASEDAKEGPRAFTEKRATQWKGR